MWCWCCRLLWELPRWLDAHWLSLLYVSQRTEGLVWSWGNININSRIKPEHSLCHYLLLCLYIFHPLQLHGIFSLLLSLSHISLNVEVKEETWLHSMMRKSLMPSNGCWNRLELPKFGWEELIQSRWVFFVSFPDMAQIWTATQNKHGVHEIWKQNSTFYLKPLWTIEQ